MCACIYEGGTPHQNDYLCELKKIKTSRASDLLKRVVLKIRPTAANSTIFPINLIFSMHVAGLVAGTATTKIGQVFRIICPFSRWAHKGTI